MSGYECKFCGAMRKEESVYKVDAQQSVIEILYECGSILKVSFPGGVNEWDMYCRGSTSQRLDKSRKLPDK